MIHVWRHPRPEGASGRCVGAGTDLPVPRRRAKRLARRIQQWARRERLPHVVHSSPLRRCAEVAAWLGRWGWQVRLDPALAELHFGAWEGLAWSEIRQDEIDRWVADFADHSPGGGESLRELLGRAAAWSPTEGCIAISHGGWMLARRWRLTQGQVLPDALQWGAPPGYGERWPL